MAGYGKGYDNVDDAAAAALMWLARQPRAVRQEYMALLFQDPDTKKIVRTMFQTSGQRDTVRASFDTLGQKVLGIVHNHPANKMGDKFPGTHLSGTDIDAAKDLGAPSYVAAMERPKQAADVKYEPEGPKVLEQQPLPGKPFLAEFPIDEFKQALMRDILGRSPNDPRGLFRTMDFKDGEDRIQLSGLLSPKGRR